MQIIQEIKDINSNIKRGIALGNFDGIHIGHQKLINSLLNLCSINKIEPCIYTFANHTLPIISKTKSIKYITSIDMKQKIFREMGISELILNKFDSSLMSLSPEEFIKNILVEKLNCKVAVVGFDYHFGYKAEGNVGLLKKLGQKYDFEVVVIDPVMIDDEIVGSSYIRTYLKEGNIKKVNKYLGRYFSLYSTVIHGDARGGDLLGFPTANISLDTLQLLPKPGVYATLIKINNEFYMGATSVGNKPTFEGKEQSVETFILDFTGDLYDKDIEVIFVEFIRDEYKFKSPEALTEQIKKDVETIKNTLQDKYNMLR